MYLLSRLMLMLAAMFSLYSAVVFAFLPGPLIGLGIVLAVLVVVGRRKRTYSSYGTASWESEQGLRSAAMIGARQGLILGRLPESKGPSVVARLKTIINPWVKAKDACEQFLTPAKRGPRNYPLVRLPNAVHTAVFAPTGVGKGVSFVIPFLMTADESCVVMDFKGELATITAKARRRMGHEIVILDPFKVVKLKFAKARLNPLDFIQKDSPLAIDDCNALAQALVVRTGEEKGDGIHFLDAAEMFIAGITATVVRYGQQDKGTRSLQTVREMLSNPQKLSMAIQLMCESDAWDGMLARMGGQLMHFVEKEKSSALTTTGRFLRFLDTLAVAECTKDSTFDPSRLRSHKMTVYLVMPPEYMRSHAGLLRMWIVSLMRAVVRGGLQ